MARQSNRIATKTTKITLPWPLYEYMDRAIQTGFYGATYTAAAERMVEKHVQHLIDAKSISALTPEELAKGPDRPRAPKQPKP